MVDPVTIGMGLSALGSGLSSFAGAGEQDVNQSRINDMARKQTQRSLNMFTNAAQMAMPSMGLGANSAFMLSDLFGYAPQQASQRLQDRGITNPYMEGSDNTGFLTKRFGAEDLYDDPSYLFRLGEGQKGIERMQSARGNYLDPSAMKEMLRYNQDYASTEYNNAYNRFNQDQNNLYNRVMGLNTAGQNAASPYTGGMNTAMFSPNAPQVPFAAQAGNFISDLGGGAYTYGMDKRGQDMVGNIMKSAYGLPSKA